MNVAQKRSLHVLVVDDSAVTRELVSAVLKGAGMSVSVAQDGIIALDKIKRSRPDVVVLDLMLPRMDGMTFLRRTRGIHDVPVVVCSSAVGDGTATALLALEEGAHALVAKPRLGALGLDSETAIELVYAVQEAAEAGSQRARRESRVTIPDDELVGPPPAKPVKPGPTSIIALGASTGGTEALRVVLSAMPENAPPIMVVQHMPERFTGAFAKRLDDACKIQVKEARDGDVLAQGQALVGRGDRHLAVIRRSSGAFIAETAVGPLVSGHRPSVDVLFRSVASAAGASAIGVLLTGMGSDGAEGLLALRQAGAHTIAQDSTTSVVFGMPRAAIAKGAACEVLPLRQIHSAVLRRVEQQRRRVGGNPSEKIRNDER